MRLWLLPMLSVIIGIGFIISGYLIAVKKRFDMITDFFALRAKYVDFRSLAKRHGIIELIGGTVMLFLGIITGYLNLNRPALHSAFFGTVAILLSLKLNKVFSKKRNIK